MATSTQVSPADVAVEVKKQGGSDTQAWSAAALVTGIESNGTLADKNPNSTACGLFQFLTSTWLGNGGGAYATTACGASLSQQVTVFLNATGSSYGFGDWRPDFVPGLDPNSNSSYGSAVSGPQKGSKVYNAIVNLSAAGDVGRALIAAGYSANVPANLADAGGVLPASPTPIPGLPNQGVNVGGSFQSWGDAITGILNNLESGFGIGWKGVLGILLGILFIGFGLVFLFHTQEKEAVQGAAMA